MNEKFTSAVQKKADAAYFTLNSPDDTLKFKIHSGEVLHVKCLVMGTDISDGYNPWIFCNPSSVVNFFGKMEKRRCRRHL